ncbi:MAG: BNR-4 repeat-containing protein [Desulfobacterales bacterium]
MRRSYPALVAVPVALCIYAMTAWGQQPPETVTITKEFEFTDASKVTGSDWQTPVATYNDAIYYVYVNRQLKTLIVKKSVDGSITKSVIFEETDPAAWYNGASVGIDRNGYIHVAGNMHHSPFNHPKTGNPYYDYAWQYVVSDKPEDISSFSFVGSEKARTIPGNWITYPSFARDLNGVLFVAFRHRIKFETGWSPGIMAAAIARYDADARIWVMLGGTDYAYQSKTFFWNDSGADGTAYQPYRQRIFFDRNNRMHITWVVDDGNGSSGYHTHVLYALSDDGGDTFKRADGSKYETLPITLDSADIVVGPDWTGSAGNLWYTSYVGATAEGHPAVSFADNSNDTAWWSVWRPEIGWSDPLKLPFEAIPARILTDSKGVLTAVDGHNKLHRSHNNGISWQAYVVETLGIHSTNFDYPFLSETGNLRFQTYSTTTGKVKVWTVEFDPNRSAAGEVANASQKMSTIAE